MTTDKMTAATMTTSQDDTLDRAAIKAHFIAERGYWRPWTEALLQHNPAFLQHYASYAGHPARVGPLSERMVELIYVALDSSATHLFPTGLSLHMARALEVGATPAEVFDVLHLVATQGVDSVCAATAMLAEEAGLASAGTPADATSAYLGGELPIPAAALEALAALDPGYITVLSDFLAQGRPAVALTDAERVLIGVALHSCFTGFQPEAVRGRIRLALAAGNTPAEVLQAIQLGAHLSVHGTALGASTYATLAGTTV